MSAVGLAEIADRTLLEAEGWSVVLVDEEQIEAISRELEQELSFLLDEGEPGSVRVFAESDSASSLVEDLTRLAPGDLALLPLRPTAVAQVARALDYARGRLSGGPTGVIITSGAGVQLLAAEAPSFWSWVGPRVWTADRAAGQLDPEARRAGSSWLFRYRRRHAAKLQPGPCRAPFHAERWRLVRLPAPGEEGRQRRRDRRL